MNYTIPTIEKELVKKCLDNDRTAQRELFLKYKDAMYTILLRILNDQEEATDALQDTFISVFKGLESFKFQSTLGAWIKTITVRTGINKQRKLNKLYFDSIDDISSEPVIWPEGMTGDTLEKAISSLPDGYRSIFILIEVEGYSHKEVAEMLQVSVGTSKSQLHYAKKTLRNLLDGQQYS